MKMNSIVRMLLVCGICVASVACQSKKSAEAAAPVQEVKKSDYSKRTIKTTNN